MRTALSVVLSVVLSVALTDGLGLGRGPPKRLLPLAATEALGVDVELPAQAAVEANVGAALEEKVAPAAPEEFRDLGVRRQALREWLASGSRVEGLGETFDVAREGLVTLQDVKEGDVIFAMSNECVVTAHAAFNDPDLLRLRDYAAAAGPGFDVVAIAGLLSVDRVRGYPSGVFESVTFLASISSSIPIHKTRTGIACVRCRPALRKRRGQFPLASGAPS